MTIRNIGSLVAIGAVLGVSGTAHAYSTTTLAQAIAGTVVVQSGDKLFSGFSYTDMNGLFPNPSNINILYGSDVVDIKGNYGIRLQAGFTLFGPNKSDLATIGYTVAVVGSTKKITDADIVVSAGAVGPSATASLTEMIVPSAGPTKTITATNTSPTAKVNLSVAADSIQITDTISESTGPGGRLTALSFAGLYVSQTGGSVPEPGVTAMLAGLGISGLLAFRRRKR